MPNHGAYVSCIAHGARDFAREGLIGNSDKSDYVTEAAHDGCT